MSESPMPEAHPLAADAGRPVFRRILCGVDDGRRSQEAARQALALASGGGEVDFVAVSGRSEPGADRYPLSRARAELALADARAAVAETDVRVTAQRVEYPSPAVGLLEFSVGHDLIVVGGVRHHSRLEAMVLGETAGAVLHGAEVPVLVARPYDTGAAEPARVLAATSARRHDRATLRVAAALARRHGARLTILHASDFASESERRALESQAALARSIGAQDPIVLLEPGRPVQSILEIAHSHADTLVVMGARRTGPAAIGSVSERVGARAQCSVLVLRNRA